MAVSDIYRATVEHSSGMETPATIHLWSRQYKLKRSDTDHVVRHVQRLGSIQHPSLPHVLNFVEVEGHPGCVTEQIDGVDLLRCLHATPRMPVRALLEVHHALADVLAAAWEAPDPLTGEQMRLAHTNLQPQCVWLGRHGEVKLLDFAPGADVVGDESTSPWPYVAPERLLGEGRSRPAAADVFSLGCMLYEGVAQRPLFNDISPLEIAQLACHSGALSRYIQARVDRHTRRAPAGIAALLHELLCVNPADRPTLRGLATAFENLVEQTTGPGLRRWVREHHPSLPASESFSAAQRNTEFSMDSKPEGPETRRGRRPDPNARTVLRWMIPGEPSSAQSGMPDLSDIVIDERRSRRPPRKAGVSWGAILVSLGLLGIGVALFAVAGFGIWWILTSETSNPQEMQISPTTADALAPATKPPPAAAAPQGPKAQASAPAPVARKKQIAPKPVAPKLAAPKPRPKPVAPTAPAAPREPDVSSDTPGSLEVMGDATVELRGEFGGFRAGTPLIPGRYDVWADFGEGLSNTGLATQLKPGGVVTVSCSAPKQKCFVKPLAP